MSGVEHLPSTYGISVSSVPSVNTSSPPGTSTPMVKDVPSSSTALSAPTASTSGPRSGVAHLPSTLKVYSPSATEDWIRCPIYATLRRRWRPRGQEWGPATMMGKAVQVGYNVYLRSPSQWADPDQAAEQSVKELIESEFQDTGKYTIAGLTRLALRGVQALLDGDLFSGHDILMVDEPLGNCRPDVVTRYKATGHLWVHDFKVSMQIRDDYRRRRLEEYDTKHQMWHYGWEVGTHFGEPVEMVRPIQVILSPKAIAQHVDIEMRPERLNFWLQGAIPQWDEMARHQAGELAPYPVFASCFGKYGKCPFYDWCHIFDGDPQRASIYYEETGE